MTPQRGHQPIVLARHPSAKPSYDVPNFSGADETP